MAGHAGPSGSARDYSYLGSNHAPSHAQTEVPQGVSPPPRASGAHPIVWVPFMCSQPAQPPPLSGRTCLSVRVRAAVCEGAGDQLWHLFQNPEWAPLPAGGPPCSAGYRVPLTHSHDILHVTCIFLPACFCTSRGHRLPLTVVTAHKQDAQHCSVRRPQERVELADGS